MKLLLLLKKKSNLKIITDQSKKIKQILSSSIDVRYKAIREKSDLKAFCLNEKFDCGIIVTPDHTHYELIKLLMDLKIHVLCVKPLVSSIKENKELIKLQMKNNVIGIVEFHKRYDDANLYTKKIIQDKLLGDFKIFNEFF